MLSHQDLPSKQNHGGDSLLHSWYLLKALEECRDGTNLLGLRLFGAKVWKLFDYSIIFSMKTKIKSKLKNVLQFWVAGAFLVLLESLGEADLIEFLFHNFQS